MEKVFNPESLIELIETVGLDTLPQLVEIFFDEFQERHIALKHAYQSGNLIEMQQQAHVLKSVCAGVGLTHLQTVAERIDLAAKGNSLSEARHHSQQFLADIDVSLSALRGFIADHAAG